MENKKNEDFSFYYKGTKYFVEFFRSNPNYSLNLYGGIIYFVDLMKNKTYASYFPKKYWFIFDNVKTMKLLTKELANLKLPEVKGNNNEKQINKSD